jgi:hypothetical protein
LGEVSNKYSDSGVVTRMCGGRRTMACRWLAGVSPVRTRARTGRAASPAAWASA